MDIFWVRPLPLHRVFVTRTDSDFMLKKLQMRLTQSTRFELFRLPIVPFLLLLLLHLQLHLRHLHNPIQPVMSRNRFLQLRLLSMPIPSIGQSVWKSLISSLSAGNWHQEISFM